MARGGIPGLLHFFPALFDGTTGSALAACQGPAATLWPRTSSYFTAPCQGEFEPRPINHAPTRLLIILKRSINGKKRLERRLAGSGAAEQQRAPSAHARRVCRPAPGKQAEPTEPTGCRGIGACIGIGTRNAPTALMQTHAVMSTLHAPTRICLGGR